MVRVLKKQAGDILAVKNYSTNKNEIDLNDLGYTANEN